MHEDLQHLLNTEKEMSFSSYGVGMQKQKVQTPGMIGKLGPGVTQGLNPALLHCRQILYSLSHQILQYKIKSLKKPRDFRNSQPLPSKGKIMWIKLLIQTQL